MTTKSRLSPMVGAVLISLTVAGALGAQEAAKKPPRTQLPSQVIPTGEEDAAKAAAPAAAARAAASSQPSAAQLDAQLVDMTSESSAGLRKVNMADGSSRLDLDGRFMSVAVATPTTDGVVAVSCHTGHDALDAAHGKKPAAVKPAPAPLEEK